jgi:hypothetical protein
MVIPDLYVRHLQRAELAALLDRHRLLVGLRAMHDYVAREPGKGGAVCEVRFPCLLSGRRADDDTGAHR